MKKNRYDLSLVIACYNEEPILEENIRQVVEILDNTRFTYEIIFVDDCSKDRTREIIDNLIVKYREKDFKKIFHEKNKGRGGAVTDGFRIAEGDVAGYIDIDLEVHARYIPSCVIAIKNGADVAAALRRFKFRFKSIHRYLMSRGYSWLMQKMLNVPLNDTETGFKFFKREKLLSILDEIGDQHWFWDTEFMVRSYLKGLKIVEIPSLFIRRFDKTSSLNDFRDTIDYLKKLLRFRKIISKGKSKIESTKRNRI